MRSTREATPAASSGAGDDYDPALGGTGSDYPTPSRPSKAFSSTATGGNLGMTGPLNLTGEVGKKTPTQGRRSASKLRSSPDGMGNFADEGRSYLDSPSLRCHAVSLSLSPLPGVVPLFHFVLTSFGAAVAACPCSGDTVSILAAKLNSMERLANMLLAEVAEVSTHPSAIVSPLPSHPVCRPRSQTRSLLAALQQSQGPASARPSTAGTRPSSARVTPHEVTFSEPLVS